MSAPRDYRDFLRDLVEACRSVIRFTENQSLDAYLADEKTRFAVTRGFEIMGEAVRHLPDEFKAAHPEIPWAMMMAVRNRLAHGYFGIDDTILFTTIDADVKPLLIKLALLARQQDKGD